MGILSIAFPYAWMGVGLLSLFFIRYQKKLAILGLILLIAGLPIFVNVFAGAKPAVFKSEKQPGHIRIMQLNTMHLPGVDPYFKDKLAKRYAFVQFLNTYKPEILCLQEFTEYDGNGLRSNIALLADSLGYRFHAFIPHFTTVQPYGIVHHGNAIFSKWPISNYAAHPYPGRKYPEMLLWADIRLGNRTLRVISTHFQSMHLTRKVETLPLDTLHWEDSTIINSGNLLRKMKHFQAYHQLQAQTLRQFTDTVQKPFLLGMDMNSVPSSFVYKQVSKGLQDVYLEKGFGFGKTFKNKQPALRIDYLFASPGIKVEQVGIFELSLSDHYAILADFQ